MDNLDDPVSGQRRWGPDRRLAWLSLAMAVAGSAWFVLDLNSEDRVVAAVLALVGAAVTMVLLRVRVRLSADRGGIMIRGPLHLRRVRWPEVALIRVEMRGRFGRRSASLELEIYDAPAPDPGPHPSDARNPASPAGSRIQNTFLRPHRPQKPALDPRTSGIDDDQPPETTLIVFGSVELGADPAEVGRELKQLRGRFG